MVILRVTSFIDPLQNGDTALHIAVALGRKRMVKKLLMFGASAFIRNHVSNFQHNLVVNNLYYRKAVNMFSDEMM